MTLSKVLVANRGEIAVRICRAAAELEIATVAIFSEDDASSLHVRKADEAHPLSGVGAAAYLGIEQIVAAAMERGCDGVHPGYGFLAENAGLARACAGAGITFIGPSPESLELFGDKSRARALAEAAGVPVLAGSAGAVSLDEAAAFLRGLGAGGAMVVKAVGGGGGRGMRVVSSPVDLESAYERARSEAGAAFGNDAVYVEQLSPRARHIEVQVIGDATGAISQLGERECSVQRRHQKVVEIAPSPSLSTTQREAIADAAVRVAKAANYQSLGTIEFLVELESGDHFAFIEANARLQVEHTVTEEVTGIDLVQAQLRVAGGETLADLGLEQASVPAARGYAIQARVNVERMEPDGSVRPAGGLLATFEPPAGPGVRVDGYGYQGYATNPNFDSLISKVVGYSTSGFREAARRTGRALAEFEIGGIDTNIPFLLNVVEHEDFLGGTVHTRWVEEEVATLAAARDSDTEAVAGTSQAGAAIAARDPLASLEYFRSGAGTRGAGSSEPPVVVGPPNTEPVPAPLQGTVTEIEVSEGEMVREGQQLFVMSALKMEHLVHAEAGGVVRQVTVSAGDTVYEGHPLAFLEVMDAGEAIEEQSADVDLDYIRPELQALFDRRQFLLDENRPEAVERRHSRNRRTVRENIERLIDAGTWVEYGGLATAAQRRRRSVEELIRKTPADGLVAGIGSVNGDLFDEQRARTMFISYDDTVFAGTQGGRGHSKTDRMLELANELSLPLIFHAEGAGGRSGDSDGDPARGFGGTVRTWERLAELSGKVPMIGVTAGWCYAGNAAIIGCTDIIIATEDALIAMGGPAVIEGGGMGAFLPEEVGAISDLAPAGSVDIVVKDHDEAIATAKQCLSYFQGSVDDWECADQRRLRHVIPENRLRSFDIRELIELLADKDSVLELRPEFGIGMVTAFVRIEGRPYGLTANNNAYIGGAIDSPGSDKVARFWQLCDAWNIPIVSLVDTPGMMIGPDVEKTGLIRHCSRLFITGANLESPRFSVILRKGYALGSLAQLTGSTRAPVFTVAWPTSEHGGMNQEASVQLAYREQLAQIEDIEERATEYERLLAGAYERGGALNVASAFEIDNVIDPAETRSWIAQGLKAVPSPEPLRRGRRPFLDTW
ncbi:MAG: carboxyl transferase domain-containing protein [Dehalococcoidia bacterium]|jgi:acetyl/propionyl-CoA carboxylase alpha subunit/acetyl-CoA carboxylase carboxyltransferase component|nr:carboxyl transferase domain-containing protein [Dehalococcoidia bacterium]